MLKKKNIDVNKYNRLLEKENESLKKKIESLTRERDNAILEKEKMNGILDAYKAQYESLIEDAKRLLEKQKKTDKAIDKITQECKDKLDRMVKDNL